MLDRHSPEYRSYMKSLDWQRKKLQRLKIDGFSCVMCGRFAPDALEVHHITYQHLGNEDVMKELCCLCPVCHKLMHNFWDRRGGYKIYKGDVAGDD